MWIRIYLPWEKLFFGGARAIASPIQIKPELKDALRMFNFRYVPLICVLCGDFHVAGEVVQ